MPELKKFLEWVSEAHPSLQASELSVQLDAYIRTFPGRVIDLLEELVDAVQNPEED